MLSFSLVACGGHVDSSPQDGGEDSQGSFGGDGGVVVDGHAADAESGACFSLSDASEPAIIAVPIDSDGGVAPAQVALAEAVVRCDYLDRCTPMAAYVRDECITAFSQSRSWSYIECAPGSSNLCGVGLTMIIPAPTPITTTDDAGQAIYDPQAEARCLQALEAEACHGPGLWSNIPACVRSGALQPCATDADCADASTGPSCVGGYCYANPCGDFVVSCAFALDGQPCDGDPPTLGSGSYPSTVRCAPGLTCRGAADDGGLGTCTTPSDVGGPCSEEAKISGCAAGLICQCGQCAIPPSEGPCAKGLCKFGVAYCDGATDTCFAVKSAGEPCMQGSAQCAPDLLCDTTSTCVLETYP